MDWTERFIGAIVVLIALVIGYATYIEVTLDRGNCLQTHLVHYPMWIQYIPTGDKYSSMTTIIHPAYDAIECAVWEFPNGKPEKEL